MLVTEVGMVTDATVTFSTFHVLHQSYSMVVLPSGMLKCLFGNELHPAKTLPPMLVTEVGIDTAANEVHP